MTIITLTNKKRFKKFVLVACFALCLVCLCAVISGENKLHAQSTATCDEAGKYNTYAPNVKQQRKLLLKFGIQTSNNKPACDTVIIPESFNSVYENYNELQKRIGLDLSSYKGKEVNRAVYKIKKSESYATLLVYKGYVIGGHIFSGIYGDSYKALV